MSKDFLLEEELYAPVRNFFVECGFKVKAEVKYCDVYAIKDNKIVIIELKKGLTMNLLIQAAQRQKIADAVYAAVPKPKINFFSRKWKDTCNLLKRLQLGLIFVSKEKDGYNVHVVLEPVPFDFKRSINNSKKKRASLLNEFNTRTSDINIGGSCRKKIITAYKEQALDIGLYIIKNGPASAADLAKAGFQHKKAYSILYNNYYGWFEKVQKGIYKVTDKGLKELPHMK